jgi:hypothetical protein
MDRKFIAWTVVCVTAIGAGIRAQYLNTPIRYDEAFTYLEYVSRPLGYSLGNYSYPNNHLFHTLLASLSVSLFGNEVWALRLPAFLAGILAIPASYVATRAFWGVSSALMAAAATAACPLFVDYAVNARGYLFLNLVLLLLIALIPKMLASVRGAWCAFTLLAALGFYTIPLMIHPFVAVCGLLLLAYRDSSERAPGNVFAKRFLQMLLGVGSLVFILYLPVFVQTDISSFWGTGMTRHHPLQVSAFALWRSLCGLMHQVFNPLPTIVGLIFALVMLLAFVAAKRRTLILGTLVVLVIWLAFFTFVSSFTSRSRFWIFIPQLCIILSAGGWDWLYEKIGRRQKEVSLFLAALLCVAGGYRSERAITLDEFPDARYVAELVQRKLLAADFIVAASGSHVFLTYYLEQRGVPRSNVLGFYETSPVALAQQAAAAPRLFVIVPKRRSSLQDALQRIGMENTEEKSLQKLYNSSSVEVYLLSRQV